MDSTDSSEGFLFNGHEVDFEGETMYPMKPYLEALEEESNSSDFSKFVGTGDFSEVELEFLAEEGFCYNDKYELLTEIFAGNLVKIINE